MCRVNNEETKIGLAVILYYPSDKDLTLIKKYKQIFADILLVDNTPLSDINYTFDESFQHVINGKNLGMSAALNYSIMWADRHKLDYLLTMDQDSDFPIQEIKKLFQCIQKNKSDEIAIFCPNYQKKYLSKKTNTIVLSKPKIDNKKNEFVTRSMTSGSVMNIGIVKKLLPLDDLFIGMVDDDISYKLISEGYKILMCGQSVFVQQVGKQKKMNMFCRLLHANILSVERYYFMGRNSRYLLKKYFDYPGIVNSIIRIRIRILLNIVLCEEQKFAKMQSWVNGTRNWKSLIKEEG